MADRAELLVTLRKAVNGLPDVEEKKMFGCEAFFAKGRVFALIWKEGRIGVKLTEPEKLAELLGQAGAAPWQPGGKRMTVSNWVLVAPGLHNAKKLQPWVTLAHALAASTADEMTKKARTAKPKKKTATAKKKTASKR